MRKKTVEKYLAPMVGWNPPNYWTGERKPATGELVLTNAQGGAPGCQAYLASTDPSVSN